MKVTWPSRKETIRYSVLVLSVSLSVAIFFAVLDFGLGKVVDSALELKRQSNVVQAPANIETEEIPKAPDGFNFSEVTPIMEPVSEVTVMPAEGEEAPTENGFELPAE